MPTGKCAKRSIRHGWEPCLLVAADVVAAGMACHGKDLYLRDKPLTQRDAADRTAVAMALGDVPRGGYCRGTDMALDMLTLARRHLAAVRADKVPS